jgi:hypothetical protein
VSGVGCSCAISQWCQETLYRECWETGVLNSRTGLATHPNMTNNETSNGEGQRKEVYYGALEHHRKRQRKHFSPSSSTTTNFRFK